MEFIFPIDPWQTDLPMRTCRMEPPMAQISTTTETLTLVVNCMNETAHLYRNNAIENKLPGHYLDVALTMKDKTVWDSARALSFIPPYPTIVLEGLPCLRISVYAGSRSFCFASSLG